MSDFAQVLFAGGRATPLLLARARAKGAEKPLSPVTDLTVDGYATREFNAWWREAFPTRAELPTERLHDDSGRPTVSFIRVWH